MAKNYMSIVVGTGVFEDVRKLADLEERSRSKMIEILLREALKKRGVLVHAEEPIEAGGA